MKCTNTQEVNKNMDTHNHALWLKKCCNFIKEVILNKTNICLFVIVVIYEAIKPFFDQLFSRYWVTPFLSYFQNGILTQIVAWLVISGIIIKCGIDCKNRKRISEIRLFRWILITAMWAMLRFSEAWIFTSLIWNVTYFDIVLFYALSVGVAYVYQFINRKPSAVIEEDGFECDEPIETSQEDLLGRSEFAQTLARKLLKTKSEYQSFAVGVLSPWGYGKTSFLNLIKDELKRNEAICIDFSPWAYGKNNNLIREFFTEVGKHLQKYADTLPRDMMEYAQILEKNEYTSWLSILLSLGNTRHNLEQQGNQLKLTLKKINRPIIVFIDDLDRLGDDEVMEILKLIRNAANFSKIKFVAAYDRSYLVEAIKKQNIESANCYLEKIFQVEYTLPAFEHEKLVWYLKKECCKFIKQEEQTSLEKDLISRNIAIEELTNLRDVKRYINSLKNSYKRLAGNVVLCNLMNLEILRLKYRAIYELLSRRWEQILIEDGSVLKLYEGDNNIEKEPLAYRQIPRYEIKSLLKSIGYKEIESNHIIRVLKLLFPPIKYSTEYGAINSKITIARYFYNAIQDRDLSIEIFKGLWQNNYEYIKEEVDNIITKNQSFSFVYQLDQFIPDSIDVCKKAIRTTFYLGKSSYNAIFSKIDKLNEHYSNEEIKALLWEIIEENGLNDYMSDFLFSEYSSLEKYLSFEEIKNIETNYLQEAIQRDLPLNKIYNYMERATHKGDDYEDNERAKKFFKEYANRHVEEFLQSLISKIRHDRSFYCVSPFVVNVWGKWMNFKEYVNSISPRTPIIDEFESFLDEFIDNGAINSIQYKFKYITIEKY